MDDLGPLTGLGCLLHGLFWGAVFLGTVAIALGVLIIAGVL